MSIQVSLISPEEILFEGEALSVSLPGSKAPFSVLTTHMPLVSELEPGKIEITIAGSEKPPLDYVISGGFSEIKNDNLSILAEGATEVSNINPHQEEKIIAELNAKVTKSDFEMSEKQEKLAIHQARYSAVSPK